MLRLTNFCLNSLKGSWNTPSASQAIAALGEKGIPVIGDFTKAQAADATTPSVNAEKMGSTSPDPLLMRDVLMEENHLLQIGAEGNLPSDRAMPHNKHSSCLHSAKD